MFGRNPPPATAASRRGPASGGPGLPGALGGFAAFEPRADVPCLTPRNGNVIAGGSASQSPAGPLREPQPGSAAPGWPRAPRPARCRCRFPPSPTARRLPVSRRLPAAAAAKSVMDAEVRREVGTAERRRGHRTPGEAEVTAALPQLLPSGSPGTRPVATEGCVAEFPPRPAPAPSLAGTGTGMEDPEPWEDPESQKSRPGLPWAGISCPGSWGRLFGVCSEPIPVGPPGCRLRAPEDPHPSPGWEFCRSNNLGFFGLSIPIPKNSGRNFQKNPARLIWGISEPPSPGDQRGHRGLQVAEAGLERGIPKIPTQGDIPGDIPGRCKDTEPLPPSLEDEPGATGGGGGEPTASGGGKCPPDASAVSPARFGELTPHEMEMSPPGSVLGTFLGTFGEPRIRGVPRRALPLLMLIGSGGKSALKAAFVSPGAAGGAPSIHLPPSPGRFVPRPSPKRRPGGSEAPGAPRSSRRSRLGQRPCKKLGGFGVFWGGFGALRAWRQRR
ncbi:translation initiation factor IF-2-like [Vidua chalybeata]|uniref:translation initiation factor IF-2-like n=1 Tax=Vidua chalybeata TaxID=81927 RepID=UPI0023A89CEC|nr:translation initiation factor IF-2-like [Vidua chalybeata]